MKTNQSTTKPFDEKLSSNAPESKPKFINMDYLMEISSGNLDFIKVFLQTFRDESKRSIEQLQNHLQRDDFFFMERTAHAMKPTGAYIGARPLTMLVSQLEQAAHNFNKPAARTLFGKIQRMVEGILNEIEEYLK